MMVGYRVREINQKWEGRIVAVKTIDPIDKDLIPVQWDNAVQFQMYPKCLLEEIK